MFTLPSFTHPPATGPYTLSLHDALPISLIGEFGQLLGHFRSPEVILCSPHDRVPPSITRRLVPRADDRIQLVQKRVLRSVPRVGGADREEGRGHVTSLETAVIVRVGEIGRAHV